MKQKRRIVFVLLSIILLSTFSLSIARATTDEETQVAKAFTWLSNNIGSWTALNTKQNIFALLALRCNNSEFITGNASLYDKSFYSPSLGRCWGPEKVTSPNQCTLTETALAKIAAYELGQDTEDIDKWIIRQNITFKEGILWYLQIDIERGQRANCTLLYNYGSDGVVEDKIFRIWENKTVSLDKPSKCFERMSGNSYDNFWFKVKRDEKCYNNEYTIKCWSGSAYYSVSWFYKKSDGSNSYYVSGDTYSAQSGYGSQEPDPIDTSLTSYCLKKGTACDYEGTAWAAYALAKSGNKEDAKAYLPYLITMMDDNLEYFPETFLYQLMGTTLYENRIKIKGPNAQKNQGYWLIENPIIYNRNYDTAHAALALGLDDEASQKAKAYLLSSQNSQGYWDATGTGFDKIRDTAFILWVFWPDSCGSGGGGGGDCEAAGAQYSCESDCDPLTQIIVPYLNCNFGEVCCKMIGTSEDCESNGGICKTECDYDEFETTNSCGTEKCCKQYRVSTCEEAGGTFCGTGRMCSGREVETADSIGEYCCIGSCIGEQSCAQQNGEICESPKYCPASKKLTANDTDYCCMTGECKDVGSLYCSAISGRLCDSDEQCLDSRGNVIEMLHTIDGDCCVGGDCGIDDYCRNIGEECSYPKECYQNVYVKTKDVDECCKSACLASCSSLGGDECAANQECKGGTMVASLENGPNVLRCCLRGTCKNKGGFPWWIIIVIVILGGATASYFLYFKKKGFNFGKKKPPKQIISPFQTPGQITRPFIMPKPAVSAAPLPQQKTNILKPAQKPVMMPSVPRPEQKMPSQAPPEIMRKFMSTRQPVKKEPVKRKIERGSDLEKTLEKLRKMTKGK